MAGSVSQQLEDLLNPLPKFTDPEDDPDEETKAKTIDEFNEDDVEDGIALSILRQHNISLLSDTDGRYLGKAVSRKQLLMDIEGSVDDDDDDGNDIKESEGSSVGEDDFESGDDDDDIGYENEEEGEEMEEKQSILGESAIKTLSKMRATDITFPQEMDLHKLTEGMDNLGESDESSEESEEGDDDSSEEDEMEDDDEDEGTVRTFSQEKIDEEVGRGKAVKDQLALWDQLLEGRIKIQKALVTVNQFPQPQTFPEFKKRGEYEIMGALKNSHKALKALQRSLLELQDQLLYQSPDTRPICLGEMLGAESQNVDVVISGDKKEEMQERRNVGEAGPPKRKLEMGEYPDFMAKRFAMFQPYCNTTLQKWHDRTRLTMGKGSKGFGAFDRNITTQVEHVLMDMERLLRRTQHQRSEYRVLGKKEGSASTSETIPTEGEEAEHLLKANAHLKDLDEDIFDDDDFYHQLLRELIERKTSTTDPNDQVAMGKQWLAIQKLRSKIKKKVDTKASKGRKVRFQIHSKLVNFMAPVDHSSMNDEARTELYRCLFGKNSFIQH
ncbi:protein AATF [Lampris incognitus]|uniref:protein AATF n=1 Tax=Lampris incognitus TaxID=2546036 RepID=UPI0024B48F84|nr:protein AATF [Lampris incognitus]